MADLFQTLERVANAVQERLTARTAYGEPVSANGVTVVPDVLANAGGVTVSYFEWNQNMQGERWIEEQVFAKLKPIMINNFNAIWQLAQEKQVNLRTAAFALALKRLTSVRL